MKHYDWDNYLEFIQEVPIPEDTLAFFSARPSAAPYPQPIYRPIPWLSRYDKGDNTTDTFFSQAINSANTIPRVLALLRADILDAPRAADPDQDPNPAPRDDARPHQVLFVQIGTGLNGFTDTVHGGVLASLVDEALSTCVEAFRQQLNGESKAKLFTANLNVSYRAPVLSPGVILVKTWLRRRVGRKWFLEAQVVAEDGTVCTEVKALWISERVATL
ncbi:HotDog domain-containing protein [Aspergillus ambiguus]|uniref:PaaI family thioesterase n=1 Tax=Aspergillus ambiguus TaxID=176160 RepID=UPI003CCCB068